jgi:hypothetical protein
VTIVNYGNGAIIKYTYDASGNRLTVQSSDSTLNNWRRQQFSSSDLTDPSKEASIWGDTADPDNDGRNNLIEYALGLNPNSGADSGDGVFTEIIENNGNPFLGLIFNRRKNDPSVQYLPEVSADKQNWFSDGSNVQLASRTDLNAEFEEVTYQDLTAITTGNGRFCRLSVLNDQGGTTSEAFLGAGTTIRGKTGSGAQYTFFSQPMIRPVVYAGTVTGLGSGSMIDASASWVDDQFNGANGAFYVEFDSGLMVDITDTVGSSKTLTLAQDVQGTVGIGDQYRIRQHATIASVFGANNEAGLLGAGRPQDADNIILYSAATQSATTYFYYPTPPFQGWWDFAAHPAGGVVIRPGAGLIVQRRASADVTFFATGPVREGPCQIDIFPGYNLTGTLKGKGLTLAGLNLYTGDAATGIAASASAATADKLIVINADGSAISYFYYKSALYQGWLNFAAVPSDNVVIPAGSAFYIERKPPNGPFIWTAPTN